MKKAHCARCHGNVINADHDDEYTSESPRVCVKGDGWEICAHSKRDSDGDVYDTDDATWLGSWYDLN